MNSGIRAKLSAVKADSLPQTYWIVLACGLSAFLLQLAMPPSSYWPLAFFCFSPVLYVLRATSIWWWLGIGFLLGLLSFFSITFSLFAWGPPLYIGGYLLSALLFAAIFFLTAILNHYLFKQSLALSFAIAWLCIHTVANEILAWPMALSLSLAFPAVELTLISKYIGIAGLDMIIAACSALFVELIEYRHRHRNLHRRSAIIAILFALLILPNLLPRPNVSAGINITAIQPAIAPQAFLASKWSLSERQKIETQIDYLLEQAVATKADLILMPEGGNELFNRRLPRRQNKINQIMDSSESTLFLSSKDLTSNGIQRNVVFEYRNGAFGETVIKTHPVHYAERNLEIGTPKMIATPFAKVGVSICFDAIFRDHNFALAEQQSELIVVVSDDSSFGKSNLAAWHSAFALLRSVELGKPMVMLMNRGESYFTNASGHRQFVDSGDQAGIYQWRVDLVDENAFAVTYGFLIPYIFAILIMLFTFFKLSVNKAPRFQISSISPLKFQTSLGLFICLICVFIANATTTLVITARDTNSSLTAIWQDNIARLQPYGSVDGIAPLFKQSSRDSCGASALAYLLTQLGDQLFENDVLEHLPLPKGGYSFQELKIISEMRHFIAEGLRGEWTDLPVAGQPPVIVHLISNHYLVVISRSNDAVFYFDPAYGKTLKVSKKQFLEKWQGYFLKVGVRTQVI